MVVSISYTPHMQRPMRIHGTQKRGFAVRKPKNSRSLVVTRAQQSGGRQAKGKEIRVNDLRLSSSARPLGEGSFGTAFAGEMDGRQVVLKKVKNNVTGARYVQEMEHVLNVYLSKACSKKHIAPFLGYADIDPLEADGKLTAGLWLVWEYEGDRTLSWYLKRRDCIELLSEDLGVSEEDVLTTVMRHVFEALNDLHSAGVVHRDVKPANLVFSATDRRFKLIDLGAAADLRTGTNYVPTETMLDPVYCAPEEYVLPTDGPDMAKQGMVAQIMSPIVWSQHRPECFDSYSAGVVLLQLALPFLRQGSGLKNWKQAMVRLNHDVKAWRERASLSVRQTAMLDANDGVGWDLVEGLLRPRQIEGDGRGGVRFVGAAGKAPRLTPTEALKHPFLKKKAKVYARKAPGSSPSRKKEGSGSQTVDSVGRVRSGQDVESMKAKKQGFGWFKSRMFDLEARIARQAEDAETQTTIVKRLEEDVKSGKATEKDLQVARSRLDAMKGALSSSMAEMGSMFENARSFFSSGGSGSRSVDVEAVADEADAVDSEVVGAEALGVGAEAGKETASTSMIQDTSSEDMKVLAEAAGNAIYAGLKLTGKALIGLADLASTAEESLSAAQAKRAAVRKEQAILEELLGRMSLTSESQWEDVAGQVRTILDDSILSESQMKRTFNAFIGGIAREERLRVRQAKIDFGTLLAEARLRSSTNYDGFVAQFGRDPRFVALENNDDRVVLFDAHMESVLKREEQLRLASKVLDVSEADDLSESDGWSASSGSDTLDRLRDEQKKMRIEYAQMEKKLKNMESLLKTSSLLDVSREPSGVTYTFAEDVPKKSAGSADKKAMKTTKPTPKRK